MTSIIVPLTLLWLLVLTSAVAASSPQAPLIISGTATDQQSKPQLDPLRLSNLSEVGLVQVFCTAQRRARSKGAPCSRSSPPATPQPQGA